MSTVREMRLLAERDAAIQKTAEREDTIRELLDFSSGWCQPMSDAAKLKRINDIGNKALEEPTDPSAIL